MEAKNIEVTVKTMDSGQQKFEVNEEVYYNVEIQLHSVIRIICSHVILYKGANPSMCRVKIQLRSSHTSTGLHFVTPFVKR